MIITVFRKWYGDEESTGRMWINGKFIAYTLEDQIRPKGEKVMHETAIPYGCYQVEITYSPKFLKDMPLIKDVPGFTGIRIHPGNDDDDTSGCLLVGKEISADKKRLIDSTAAFNEVYAMIKTAQDAGKKITICFVNIRKRLWIGAGILAGLSALITGIFLIIKHQRK